MGQILHGSATTTHATRAGLQRSTATAEVAMKAEMTRRPCCLHGQGHCA
jgi:hypothetical protein